MPRVEETKLEQARFSTAKTTDSDRLDIITNQNIGGVSNSVPSIRQRHAWDQMTNPGSGPFMVLSARMLSAGGHFSSGRSLKGDMPDSDKSSMHIPSCSRRPIGFPGRTRDQCSWGTATCLKEERKLDSLLSLEDDVYRPSQGMMDTRRLGSFKLSLMSSTSQQLPSRLSCCSIHQLSFVANIFSRNADHLSPWVAW
ncbi:hypothetical protein ASPBRDRAFT_26705 [Aspergillus brasiliensis CBS 101740]|uniref:Uncharacterized protein n=1 Tax=Aspergillus brasiliensis (strain CBS 101740 / IMI 381727 / IBT 21946) TaxID=767769 RepID=A0A1L9UWZ4_ASPBC|nr:hypothetical protein ASPBRDRAFT_26705 [Aspergillus brasiliensis CBS 101740]